MFLGKTSVLREKYDSCLLISHVALGKIVSPKIIARWAVETLEKSEINTTIYKAHSALSILTSLARCKGLSLTEIAKVARWTNFPTFGNFYDEPVNNIKSDQSF